VQLTFVQSWEFTLTEETLIWIRCNNVVQVDEEMKVQKVEYYYERGNFLAGFLSAPAAAAAAASASGCPVMTGN
jgi:hypothetical protein